MILWKPPNFLVFKIIYGHLNGIDVHGRLQLLFQEDLTDEEEAKVVDCLLLAATWGYPVTTTELRLIVKQYLDKTKKGGANI